MLQDIPRTEWADTLARFTREHRAWIATVDSSRADERVHISRPLASIRAEEQQSHIAIRIDLAGRASTDSTIRVDAPVRIQVESSDGNSPALKILNADGGRTTVRFRTTPGADLLDGVVTGEL
jgi:hypothetical protein